MQPPLSPLFAQTPGDVVSSVAKAARYQFAQFQSFSEWWQTPVLILVSVALLGYVIYMYRRDSVELRPGIGILLAVLRIAAFVGLLLVYLDLQKWSEQQETQNSRVLVLVDGSISMALNDVDNGSASATASGAAGSASAAAPPTTRIGQIIAEFTDGKLLNDLRQKNDVTVWRFDQHLSRIAMLPKRAETTLAVATDEAAQAARQQRIEWLRLVAYAGLALVVLSIVGYGIARLAGRRIGWGAGIAATVGVLIAFGSVAALSLANPDDELLALLGWRQTPAAATSESAKSDATKAAEKKHAAEHKIDWAAALKANGIETRIGDALRQLVSDNRSQPIAGIVLITDGGQNAGLDPSAAVEVAQEAHIPIYTIGLGTERRPTSVEIADFAVPVRVYPGDSFAVTADLMAHGLSGRSAQVELASRPAGKQGVGAAKPWSIEGQQTVTLPADGKKERVKFELSGITETGRRTLQLRVKPPLDPTGSGARPKELTQDADVQIVDRKNRVLLIAGGPTREYRFLRNQLRRDHDTVVDVLLQTSLPGISQDANQILDHFPSTMQQLSEYDTIVAFDPNWQKLGGNASGEAGDEVANDEAIDLLERWVAEEAGGLVLVAGPVYTDDWVNDPKLGKLRALYPVEFDRLLADLKTTKFGHDKPGAIEFTREGEQAEFLWLSDSGSSASAAASEHIWAGFKGVYGDYPVRRKKPSATVYARYDDPDLGSSDVLSGENRFTAGNTSGDSGSSGAPIYMAGQLYGAGRVFYEGSGEMWRLRSMDESYFEQFYTKLLRYVSQGRMLRGSRRGYLSVDRDSYLLGSVVDIEARLTDAQHNPLNKTKVVAQVSPQDAAPVMVPLVADPGRKGMYRGQFIAVLPGQVRIELPIPDSDEEPLSRQIMVKVPDLEKDNPQRNDPLLSEIAGRTKGKYYVGIPAAMGASGLPPLVGQLKDQTRTTIRSGDRDKPWERLWSTWLLCGICGALCLEWLIRRLSRLA